MKLRFLLFVLGLLSAGLAAAQVEVSHAWVRASLPQQKASGAFMQLLAPKSDLRLVGASTPVAEVAEIHRMSMQDNIARMERVDELLLKAGQRQSLQPGGYHLMLMGLKAPLEVGQRVPITLSLFDASGQLQKFEVSAEVRPLNAVGSGMHGGKMKH